MGMREFGSAKSATTGIWLCKLRRDRSAHDVSGDKGKWLTDNNEIVTLIVKVVRSGYALAANSLDGAAVGLIPKTLGMLTGQDLKHASMRALISGGNLQDAGDPVPRIDGDMIASITQFKFKAGNMWAKDEHLRDAMPDVSNWYTNEFLLLEQ